MNAYAVHVLASAVAPQLHHISAEQVEGLMAVPDTVPLTADDHAHVLRLRRAEVKSATIRWVECHFGTPELGRRWKMSDDEFLEWYRREELPLSDDPEQFVFRRSA